MPIIKLTHVQTYLGETMNNRYFYFTPTAVTVPILDDLMDRFEFLIVPLVLNLQSAGVSNVRLDSNEVGGINFSVLNLTGAGGVTGEASPSWNALSFILSRTNASTKSGGKRIGGLSESILVNNSVFPDPTYAGFIQDYADAMSLQITGTLANYTPFLVKFDPANPGTVLASQPISGCSFTRLSTQNTRKP